MRVKKPLIKEAEVQDEPKVYEDLNHLIGTWVHDSETDKALMDQRKINPKDWE